MAARVVRTREYSPASPTWSSTLPLLRNTLLLAGGIVLTLADLIASRDEQPAPARGLIPKRSARSRLQSDLGALMGELVNAEAGQRGFLLTGKDSYLRDRTTRHARINTS